MQKTTDKLIREELLRLHSCSMKDAFEGLSPAERKAAKESIKELITEWARSTGRAEVFKSAEYPEFIGREGRGEKEMHERLLKCLEKAARKLESELGDEFVAISLYGSHGKGYAGMASDADVRIITRNKINYDKELSLRNMIRQSALRAAGCKAHFDSVWLNGINEEIARVEEYHAGRDVTAMVLEARDAAGKTFGLFDGKFFGSRIKEARKEIIQELARSPHGHYIWENVVTFHRLSVVGLSQKGISSGDDVTPVPTRNAAAVEKLDVREEEFKEIVKAREEFALPSLEEMKKRYGIA